MNFSEAAQSALGLLEGRWDPVLEGNDVEPILRGLAEQGLMAREVRVADRKDLWSLEWPALAQLRGGGWLILTGASGDALQGRDGRGAFSLDPCHHEEHLTGRCVEIGVSPALAGSLLGALGVELRGRLGVVRQVLLAALAVQGLALAIPLLTAWMVNEVLHRGISGLIPLVGVGVFAAHAGMAWVGWLKDRALLFLEVRVQNRVAHGLVSHMLHLPFRRLEGQTIGDLLQVPGSLGALRDLLSERAVGTALDGAGACVMLVGLWVVHPALAVLLAVVGVGMAAVSLVVGRWLGSLMDAGLQAQANEQSFLVELVSGIATLKACGGEEAGLRAWMARLRPELACLLRRQRLGLWGDLGLEAITQGGVVATLLWCGQRALEGRGSLGGVLAAGQLAGAFLVAVSGLCTAFLAVAVAQPQMAKVDAMLMESPELPQWEAEDPAAPAISLENVWFRYEDGGPWVLKGLNLQVKAGDRIWLRAPSGTGKSTLLRLLAGLYEPTLGRVAVRGASPRALGDAIGYLPQFVGLYSGSIMQNLKVLSGGASRARIEAAAEASGLLEVLATFPMGFQTLLPAGGGTLSGGQKQLLAITALMASERPILLMDEAMANLDWLAKRRVMHSPFFEGRTLVYASHEAGFPVVGEGGGVVAQFDLGHEEGASWEGSCRAASEERVG